VATSNREVRFHTYYRHHENPAYSKVNIPHDMIHHDTRSCAFGSISETTKFLGNGVYTYLKNVVSENTRFRMRIIQPKWYVGIVFECITAGDAVHIMLPIIFATRSEVNANDRFRLS